MSDDPKVALSIEQPSDPMPQSAGVVSDLGVVIARAASDAGELDKAFALAVARHRHGERAVEDILA